MFKLNARWFLALCLSGLLFGSIAVADPDMDPPGRVARINLAEGPVSIEPSGSTTWTSDVANWPLTTGDRVWADQNARVELHVGSTAVRLGQETGITLGTVDDRTVRLQLSAGSLQFRVRALGADETFEVVTPFAHIAVLTPGTYRLDVSPRGDELRVATAFGQVAVTDGSGAVTVDSGRQARFHGAVAAAEFDRLTGADDLDRWAEERDRREDRAVSTRYVSREMTGYEDLDNYGNWQVVDDYGPVWYPTVAADWSPYRYGHWAFVSPWGWTWVDDAPWGFAPFHYGRWVNVRGVWGWAPGPRHGTPYYAPALVGWGGGFGVGVAVGVAPVAWFPLGWNEVYVPSYHASRLYVQNINVTNIHVTNVTVNEYYDRVHGGGRDGMQPEYRNFGIKGSVVATTRDAFVAGQSVHAHPSDVPHFDHMRINYAAPDVRPATVSYGRPAVVTPRQEMFIRSAPATAPPGAGTRRPEARFDTPRVPDYRPAPSPATEPPMPPEQNRNPWRPSAAPTGSTNPSAPEPRPSLERTPAYRPAMPSVNPTPSAPVNAPESRPERPVMNEWRPAPTQPTQPSQPIQATPPAEHPEYHPETSRAPDYRPASPPPMPREMPRPAAAPPAAPAPHPQAPRPEKKEERRDSPR